MRTSEYRDRLAQYHWIQELLGLRKVDVQEFSRLNFLYTLLSKRKLKWFVAQKKVDGWDDPRFPTVRGKRARFSRFSQPSSVFVSGMLRRGVTPEGLRTYMLMQGASKRIVDLEWHKFWATNKKVIDPVAPRFVAVNGESSVTLVLQNGPESVQGVSMPLHPKNDVSCMNHYAVNYRLCCREEEFVHDPTMGVYNDYNSLSNVFRCFGEFPLLCLFVYV